ncbi:hypothetical protein PLEOSDRAFT_160772 [Pleurotus ostreatus PC15]|uniref:Uncharacterized protein n=2 Tax=Pleurotus TaxID=5320 RepID=A0A067NQ18_PLEO1|nr:hypothetical protein CCMSSC00406_0009127 [Pleurotus cornucopiae]KDQ26187.1 hypothetical protein PLEOSDRAFT_160772 [Pleurotus ostreatus PC15]
MRSIPSVLVAAAACAIVFQPAGAVNPGNDALHINVTDAFEAAILKECTCPSRNPGMLSHFASRRLLTSYCLLTAACCVLGLRIRGHGYGYIYLPPPPFHLPPPPATFHRPVGQDIFDGLATQSCNVLRCFGVVTHLAPCLAKCLALGQARLRPFLCRNYRRTS